MARTREVLAFSRSVRFFSKVFSSRPFEANGRIFLGIFLMQDE
ncbi:unnamed protein product, partial [Amoebophrya sp. A120]|eukprot:GSA120T00011779001.1